MKLYLDSINDRKFGHFRFAVGENGLRLLAFGQYTGLTQILDYALRYGFKTDEDKKVTAACKKQLIEYFAGKRKKFDLRLDIDHFTDFKKRVLENCFSIPAITISLDGWRPGGFYRGSP